MTLLNSPLEYIGILKSQVTKDVVDAPLDSDSVGFWDGIHFTLDQLHFIIETQRVKEVLVLPYVTPLPGVKPWVMGIANVNDKPTTMIDLKGFLALSESMSTQPLTAIIINHKGGSTGFVVDEVQGRLKHPRDSRRTTLPNEVPHTIVPFADGHFEESDRYIVFDIDKLLGNEEFLAVT